jgi:N-methylhydantoinase B
METHKIDPVQTTIISNRLQGITREMGAGMLRGARSPIFAENRDFVTAIFDKRLRMVGQTAYIPVLLGASPFAIQSIAEHFNDDVHEDDVMVLNDPYRGNNHLPDITVAKPIFFNGRLEFWVLARGHHADVGGRGASGNPYAKTIWEEGLRIPPCRLYRKGKYNADIWNMILLNTRLRSLVEGDLLCQVGACKIGEQGSKQLLQRYGPDTLEETITEMLNRSEIEMRSLIGKTPNGTYLAKRKLDYLYGGNEPRIMLSLKIEKEELTFDFTGTDPQIPAYFNSSFPNTVSSCYVGLFSTLGANVELNEGSMRPIRVCAPEGSLVNPSEGAPTTMCTRHTCAAIVECVWLALAQVAHESVQAGWARPGGAGGSAWGFNPKRGRPFACIYQFAKGGGGATYGFDGWDHISPVGSMGGSRVPDPELHEIATPNFILGYEYEKDSAGAGRWRGGVGTWIRIRFEADNISFSHTQGPHTSDTAPFGLQGGLQGSLPRGFLRKATGDVIELKESNLYVCATGDVLEGYSSGGGGYGDPYERASELVLADVVDELLSLDKARETYGVIINPVNFEIDHEATAALRQIRLSKENTVRNTLYHNKEVLP